MRSSKSNVKLLKFVLALTLLATILFYAFAFNSVVILNFQSSPSLALFCMTITLLAIAVAFLLARKLNIFGIYVLTLVGYFVACYPTFSYYWGKGLDMALLPVSLLLPACGLGIAIGALFQAIKTVDCPTPYERQRKR